MCRHLLDVLGQKRPYRGKEFVPNSEPLATTRKRSTCVLIVAPSSMLLERVHREKGNGKRTPPGKRLRIVKLYQYALTATESLAPHPNPPLSLHIAHTSPQFSQHHSRGS